MAAVGSCGHRTRTRTVSLITEIADQRVVEERHKPNPSAPLGDTASINTVLFIHSITCDNNKRTKEQEKVALRLEEPGDPEPRHAET